jgi:hypothetical protein
VRQLEFMSQLGTPSAAAINNVKGKGRTGMSIVHSLIRSELSHGLCK